MPFFPSSLLFYKNNARNICYMAVRILQKCLDLRKKCLFSDSRLDNYSLSLVGLVFLAVLPLRPRVPGFFLPPRFPFPGL